MTPHEYFETFEVEMDKKTEGSKAIDQIMFYHTWTQQMREDFISYFRDYSILWPDIAIQQHASHKGLEIRWWWN